MYGSLIENVVLRRIFLGFICHLWDVYSVHICSILKILIDCSLFRNDFKNRGLTNNSITTTKNVLKIEQIDEKEIIDYNIDLLRKFQLRNMFLNI